MLFHLDDQDLITTLRIESNLDRRKILWSIEKMKNIKFVKKDNDYDILSSQEDTTVSCKDEASEKIPSVDDFFDEVQKGRLRSLQESVNNGFDVNLTNGNGDTPLMIAILHGNRKLIDFLVHKGANVNHVNINGNSALHFALAYDKTGQIGEYLIEKGADDSIKNSNVLTPYEGLDRDNKEILKSKRT